MAFDGASVREDATVSSAADLAAGAPLPRMSPCVREDAVVSSVACLAAGTLPP